MPCRISSRNQQTVNSVLMFCASFMLSFLLSFFWDFRILGPGSLIQQNLDQKLIIRTWPRQIAQPKAQPVLIRSFETTTKECLSCHVPVVEATQRSDDSTTQPTQTNKRSA